MIQESNIRSSKEHTFIIENEYTQETTIIKHQIEIVGNIVNLKCIIEQIADSINNIFKIYDFSQNKYCHFKDFNDSENNYFVPANFIQSEIILIKYSKDSTETGSIKSSMRSVSDTTSVKKQRSKERTIAEIIELVKQWREIHLNPINGKKINLQEAAAMLGISKKSLDDYFYQLRLGQKYAFQFKNNLNEKVGVLRTFIKEIKPSKKGQVRSIPQKHPKQLKIIQQLGQINGGRNISYNNNMAEMIAENPAQNEMDQQKIEKNSIREIQNQFYNDFDYLGDQPADPFLNFEGNLRKNDDYSDQLFF